MAQPQRNAALSAPFPFADLEISLSQRMAAKRAAIAETEVVAGGQLRAVLIGARRLALQDAAIAPMAAESQLWSIGCEKTKPKPISRSKE